MDDFPLGYLVGHQNHLDCHKAHRNAQHCADPGNGDDVAEQDFLNFEGLRRIQNRLGHSLGAEDTVEEEVDRLRNCLGVEFLRMVVAEEEMCHKAAVEHCMVVVVGLIVHHMKIVGLPWRHKNLAVGCMIVVGEGFGRSVVAEMMDCTELRRQVGMMLAEQNLYSRLVGCYATSIRNCYLAGDYQCLIFDVSRVSHTEEP